MRIRTDIRSKSSEVVATSLTPRKKKTRKIIEPRTNSQLVAINRNSRYYSNFKIKIKEEKTGKLPKTHIFETRIIFEKQSKLLAREQVPLKLTSR